MSEVSGAQERQRKYASGGIEFHNQMRALDMYHKDQKAKLDMLSRKMEAKQQNTDKFREVRTKELQRELDELEDSSARAKLSHQRILKRLDENQHRLNEPRKTLINTSKDLNNQKLQFIRDLQQFDPRWKDKLHAKKQMQLNRLEQRRTQLQVYSDELDNDLARELDHQIKDTKFDIYKLQKHAEIKQNLINEKQADANLYRELHGIDADGSIVNQETLKKQYKEELSGESDEEEKQLPSKNPNVSITITSNNTAKPKSQKSDPNPIIKEENPVSQESDNDLLKRLQEKQIKRKESFAKKQQEREEKERLEELEREERQKKQKSDRDKLRREQEEKADKQRQIEDKLKKDALKKQEEDRKKRVEELKNLQEPLNKPKKTMEPVGKSLPEDKVTKPKEYIKKDTVESRPSKLDSKRQSNKGTIEYESEEEESDDNFGGLKGTFKQGETQVKAPVKMPSAESKTSLKQEEPKSAFNSLLQKGGKVMGTQKEEEKKNPNPPNEIEIAAVDSEFHTSYYGEDDEDIEEDEEEDILELLEYIRQTQDLKKNSIIKSIFNFIQSFEELESGNLLNLDIHTTLLYSEMMDNSDRWKKDKKVATPEN